MIGVNVTNSVLASTVPVVIEDEAGFDTGEHCGGQPDRRPVADHDHVLRPVLVVEISNPEIPDYRQVPLEDVMSVLTTRHGHIERTLMPAFVDGVEDRDRLIVGAVLKITRLNFVNTVDFGCLGRQLGADLSGSLRGTVGDGVQQQSGTLVSGPGELTGLQPALIGEFSPRGPGIQSALDIGK